MTPPKKDTRRAIAVAKQIIDDRDPETQRADVLVTLEHVVAIVLMATMGRDHRKAVTMLNEGLVPGVDARLSHSQHARGRQ